MSDETITELLRNAPFSFVGTIEHIGAATVSNIPIDERTAVVRVDYILHSPPLFSKLEGQIITVQLMVERDLPVVGESAAFFVEGRVFAESMAVAEVGRLTIEEIEPYVRATAEAGQTRAFATLERRSEIQRLREHAENADAVVLGRVIALERALEPAISEHDPDWWKATLNVFHVEKGQVKPGEVEVLFANSIDVQWRTAPKPKASQGGLWLLHATEGKLSESAPFVLLHPEDFQPTQELDVLRG